jgi:hypothetical protein
MKGTKEVKNLNQMQLNCVRAELDGEPPLKLNYKSNTLISDIVNISP